MSQGDQPLAKEGYALMGAAFEVRNVIGGGLLEEIYQQSLDMFVFERIVVELKSVSSLCPDQEAQLLNYMRITQSPVGSLINFGPIGKLQYKRFILSEFLQ